jgi:hypothetical protein
MAQQDINKTIYDNFKRVLFVKSPAGLVPVASGGILCGETPTDIGGRIIEEHTPPTPILKTSEIKILNGPSVFHGMGVASYRIELKILFKSRVKYAEFITNTKNELIYYDENGYIYQCAVIGEPGIERIEGGQRYIVKLTLQGVKKNKYDDEYIVKFTDIDNTVYRSDIEEITVAGLVSTFSSTGNVYTYRPGNALKRSEIAAFLNRLRKYIKRAVQ